MRTQCSFNLPWARNCEQYSLLFLSNDIVKRGRENKTDLICFLNQFEFIRKYNTAFFLFSFCISYIKHKATLSINCNLGKTCCNNVALLNSLLFDVKFGDYIIAAWVSHVLKEREKMKINLSHNIQHSHETQQKKI